MDDAIQFPERKGDVIPPGGIPHRKFRAIAAGDQRQMMLAGVTQDRSHLFRRGRRDGAIRDLAIHRQSCAGSGVRQHLGLAHERRKFRPHGIYRQGHTGPPPANPPRSSPHIFPVGRSFPGFKRP